MTPHPAVPALSQLLRAQQMAHDAKKGVASGLHKVGETLHMTDKK
jgi:hypothetical protein